VAKKKVFKISTPGSEHPAKDLQRARHLPRRRRDAPAGRRQQEALHRRGGRQPGVGIVKLSFFRRRH
jgi:hypothetical protein